MTDDGAGVCWASLRKAAAYEPPLTIRSAASGTCRSTWGQARISVSWPLRGTRRETQTTTGRPARPWRARVALPPSGAGPDVAGAPGRPRRGIPAAAPGGKGAADPGPEESPGGGEEVHVP